MSLTIPTWLVKISVIRLKNLTPVSFLHNVVFCLDQFLVLKGIDAYSIFEQHKKCILFHRAHGNQSGEIWTQPQY